MNEAAAPQRPTGGTTQPHQGGTPDPAGGRVAMTLVTGSGPHATAELQTLLRRRLATFALIGLAAAVIFVVVKWEEIAWSIALATNGLLILTAGGCAAVLWSRRPLSLLVLRGMELLGLAVVAGTIAWPMIDGIRHRLPAQFALLGEREVIWFWPPPDGGDVIQVRGVLGHFPLTCLVAYQNLHWLAVLMVYGTFVPNTWRRCVLVVGSVIAVPIGLTVYGLITDDAISRPMAWEYLFGTLWWMGFGAAVAVFGSHRIERLRQEAFEARKLGQYQLTRKLGSGGMGEVYLAEHVLLRRPCAIKLIRPERAGDPKNLLRFEREVRATATLTSWHAVEIFDYGRTADGTFYYVMEYLPGLTLDQLVREYGPLPPERAVHLLRQVCAALREAHAIGLVHRDVKPGNVIVSERGGLHDVAKLLDFGLVQGHGLGRADEKLTQEGAVAGTPAYVSAEQAAGADHLDARSDVYSVGATAYFLLTGRPPFVRATTMRTLAAHISEPAEPPERSRAGLPADVQAVVMRCLEKDPAVRFADAEALDEALAGCECAGGWTRRRAAEWWRERGPC